MRWLALLALVLAMLPGAPARAADVWIEARGFAIQSGPEDAASAKRRAVADALLMAALSGGADVTGHTVVDRSVVTSDLLIVRPVGRIKEHRLLSITREGDTWRVDLQARVGLDQDRACPARRTLVVTTYAPVIRVAPEAPAWAEPLAQEVANELVRQLGARADIELRRVTDRPMPRLDAAQERLDYTALRYGSVRLGPGEHGFLPEVTVDVGGTGRRASLRLDLVMRLVGGNGEETRQEVQRAVKLPGLSPLGGVAGLVAPDRRQMAERLTAGLSDAMTRLMDIETCKPVLTRLEVAGRRITAPVGRRQGLAPGAVAFTADAEGSVEMLEVVSLGRDGVELRPLDPNRPARAFAGRVVRFLDTGM